MAVELITGAFGMNAEGVMIYRAGHSRVRFVSLAACDRLLHGHAYVRARP
jgi:hypothetical protein